MTNTFAGKPIVGEVTRGYERPRLEQWGAEMFLEQAQMVFDAAPRLQAFAWVQYTPYFNDGEPCVFSVGAPDNAWLSDDPFPPGAEHMDIYGEDGGEDNLWSEVYEDELYAKWSTPESELTKAQRAWKEFTDSFGHYESLMLEKFGDHAKVVFTRDGTFYIDYYEHD